MIFAEQIERAKAVRIEDELVRHGIGFKGRGQERAGPCLVCGGRDRFSINLRKQIWNCRGCQRGGDVIALVQHVDGISFAEAIEILTGTTKDIEKRVAIQPGHDRQYDDETRRLELAHQLFEQADRIGPEAIRYFEGRGIDIASVPEHGGLRCHPKCPWEGTTKRCVLALYTDAITNTPRGIWRRPIDGSSKPKALGPTAGCVIRLWADDAVEQGLVLGEGVETTLSAATRIIHKNTVLAPAWAAGFAQNMRAFPVLPGIDVLTLLVDHDTNGTGQKAADECAARWTAAGREVELLAPKIPDTDFNDLTRRAP